MDIKYIDITEFREKGYLQELNRLFLHPLGLALEVVIDDNGNESLGGIWDYRDDPSGIIYNISSSDSDRLQRFQQKADFIMNEQNNRKINRTSILNYFIPPIQNK
jgi:hypothetical protein